MKQGLYSVLLLLVGVAISSAKSFKHGDFKHMERLLGTWRLVNDNGTQYEHWAVKDVDEYVVRSYKIDNKDTLILEDVTVKLDSGAIYYIPIAYGQNNNQPVSFKMVKCSRNKFVFENSKHDFPQRISYHLKAKDTLAASIEGDWKGKYRKVEFSYVR